MDQTSIRAEFIRRQYVCDAIKIFIKDTFEHDPIKKLRRGALQKEISDLLGITINTPFCRMVNMCMEECGFIPREIRGNYYYKNIKRKSRL